MTDFDKVEKQIDLLRYEGWYACNETESGAIADTMQALLERNKLLQEDKIKLLDVNESMTADTIKLLERNKLLEDVAEHARRHRADPSWNQHAKNLDDAIAKLQEQK